MLKPTCSTGSTSPNGFRIPSRAQVEAMVTRFVRTREPGASQDAPPVKNPEAYTNFDVTQEGTADRIQTAYLIKGRIWVKEVGFAGPNFASWADYGPLPQFSA